MAKLPEVNSTVCNLYRLPAACPCLSWSAVAMRVLIWVVFAVSFTPTLCSGSSPSLIAGWVWDCYLKFRVYGRKQANIHTHMCNAVMLVWGSLRLAPINKQDNHEIITCLLLIQLYWPLEQQWSGISCTARQCCDWVIPIRPYHKNAMNNIIQSNSQQKNYTPCAFIWLPWEGILSWVRKWECGYRNEECGNDVCKHGKLGDWNVFIKQYNLWV